MVEKKSSRFKARKDSQCIQINLIFAHYLRLHHELFRVIADPGWGRRVTHLGAKYDLQEHSFNIGLEKSPAQYKPKWGDYLEYLSSQEQDAFGFQSPGSDLVDLRHRYFRALAECAYHGGLSSWFGGALSKLQKINSASQNV
ncbi:hypothetical protein Dda_7054 [Drechslerella dactyloides]|uniref:Uncharacterized protein n=1 Tax=Drechslerella dactyloides TaxID=74499 RepID=A0AAD6IT19_DREDA|nr:hypothetical protein Dda_7054 [Drechslerella dactyloides]